MLLVVVEGSVVGVFVVGRVRVRMVPGGDVVEVDVGGVVSVRELLRRLGLSVQGYVVVRGGEVLTEEDVVSPGDELEVYRVASGG